MPNYRRYAVEGDWDLQSEDTVCRIYTADLLDKHDGLVYREGAYKVVPKNDTKPAVFFGETAWMRAKSLASDLFWQRR